MRNTHITFNNSKIPFMHKKHGYKYGRNSMSIFFSDYKLDKSCLKPCKKHDYFSVSLPNPFKSK